MCAIGLPNPEKSVRMCTLGLARWMPRTAGAHAFEVQSTFVPLHREVARGRVIEPLPEGMYRVELENGRSVLAHVADRLAMHFARLRAGMSVEVELAERDRSRGRIRRRL